MALHIISSKATYLYESHSFNYHWCSGRPSTRTVAGMSTFDGSIAVVFKREKLYLNWELLGVEDHLHMYIFGWADVYTIPVQCLKVQN